MEAATTHIIVAIAALAGVLVGWWCRPRWPPLLVRLFRSWRFRLIWTPTLPLFLGQLNLTFLSSVSSRILPKRRDDSSLSVLAGNRLVDEEGRSFSSEAEDEQAIMTAEDLQMLLAYIDEKDGGLPWKLMMDRSTSTLSYRAWCRDPKFGPTQYRCQTVIENVKPELLRDFFWDDEFRPKWDDMIVYYRTLQEYPHTRTMIVHWIRKYPFFCSSREYIIIRRIWESGSTYYCVSKSIPFPAIPRHQKPRRIDIYYSSWRIRAVESRNRGDSTASEVLLFHCEEMGIPKMLAKVGVQRGMWGLVQKMELGVRAYQMARLHGVPPSQYALLARIGTQVPISTNQLLEKEPNYPEDQFEEVEACGLAGGRNILKWLVVGGVLVSWALKGGELNKVSIFRMVRGFKKFCSKGNREVSFFTDHEEIAKRMQDLGCVSEPFEKLIQKGRRIASRQCYVVQKFLREQSEVSKLLARSAMVSQQRSRLKAPRPGLLAAVMKIFGWRL